MEKLAVHGVKGVRRVQSMAHSWRKISLNQRMERILAGMVGVGIAFVGADKASSHSSRSTATNDRLSYVVTTASPANSRSSVSFIVRNNGSSKA